MAHSSCFIFVFFLLLFLIYPTASSSHICETYCDMDETPIQFPFQLVRDNEANQINRTSRCGYPGFELSCNKSRTMIHLPHSGHFLVDTISYENQKLWIRDPEDCLPKRFLNNNSFNLKDSIFQLSNDYMLMDFTFFNCSSNVTRQYPLPPVPCLSSDHNPNFSVVAVLSDPQFAPWVARCDPISSASLPYSITNRLYWMDLNYEIGLQWNTPSCGDCVANKGRCDFLTNTGLAVACYLPHRTGLSKFAKFGLSFGVGIPGLFCVIWIVYLCTGKRRESEERRRRSDVELNNNVAGRSSVVVMGLDGATIEKYPMTRIGDSGRLPDPNNNVCSICLGEYQPQDTLRTIPDCNHYFHANCIDSWLHMNATCPLCRKLPHS